MKTREKGVRSNSELFFTSPSGRARGLFFYVTCTGEFSYEDGYQLERETYHSFLLLHIKKGTMQVVNEGLSFEAHGGDTVLLNCHSPHSYLALEATDALWFHFEGGNAKAMYEELKGEYGKSIVVRNSVPLIQSLHKIYESYMGKGKKDEAKISAYISRILAEFFTSQREIESDKALLVDRVMNYIEENYQQDLPLEVLAQVAGLSEYYFSRIFKKYTGFTLHEYVLKTRITGAKILLKSTDLSVKEIAFRCGFSNESAFSNTFKKMTKMTAVTFRKTEI